MGARRLIPGRESEVDIICAGINHQTWFIKISGAACDMIPTSCSSSSRRIPSLRTTEKVRIDVLRRFGYYSHRIQRPPQRIPAVVSQARRTRSASGSTSSSWINGETGGYLRVCTEGRNWFETDFPNWLKAGPAEVHAGQAQRRARQLHHRRRWRPAASIAGTSTSSNDGHITNLPDGCIIEIPGYVDRNGINMPGRRRPAAGLRRDVLAPASACRRWAWRPPCTAT